MRPRSISVPCFNSWEQLEIVSVTSPRVPPSKSPPQSPVATHDSLNRSESCSLSEISGDSLSDSDDYAALASARDRDDDGVQYKVRITKNLEKFVSFPISHSTFLLKSFLLCLVSQS